MKLSTNELVGTCHCGQPLPRRIHVLVDASTAAKSVVLIECGCGRVNTVGLHETTGTESGRGDAA